MFFSNGMLASFFLNDGEEKKNQNIMFHLLSSRKVVAAIIKHTHCVISKHKQARGQTFSRLSPVSFFFFFIFPL